MVRRSTAHDIISRHLREQRNQNSRKIANDVDAWLKNGKFPNGNPITPQLRKALIAQKGHAAKDLDNK